MRGEKKAMRGTTIGPMKLDDIKKLHQRLIVAQLDMDDAIRAAEQRKLKTLDAPFVNTHERAFEIVENMANALAKQMKLLNAAK